MLKKIKKKPIPASLTLIGQGEKFKLDVVFRNGIDQKQIDEITNAVVEDKTGTRSFSEITLLMVESWDSEYALTKEGVDELEADLPGAVLAISEAYYRSRRVALEKN